MKDYEPNMHSSVIRSAHTPYLAFPDESELQSYMPLPSSHWHGHANRSIRVLERRQAPLSSTRLSGIAHTCRIAVCARCTERARRRVMSTPTLISSLRPRERVASSMASIQARSVAVVRRCPHLSLKHAIPAVDCTTQ